MPSFEDPREVKAFQDNVAHMISRLESAWTGDDKWTQQGFGMIVAPDQAIEETLDHTYRDASRNHIAPNDELRRAAIEAKVALNHKTTRSVLCRALKSAGEGSYDITKVLVSAFLPLALAGTIPVSVTPLVCSLVCFTVLRVGISVFCADEPDKSSSG